MEKKTYSAPQLVLIKLDNEISLALQSASIPPQGPGEFYEDELYQEGIFTVIE